MADKPVVTFGERDIYAPIMYLLCHKNIISEEELKKYIESYTGYEDIISYVRRIDEMLG